MKLNDKVVDQRLVQLFERDDWASRRTDAAWLAAFPHHVGAESMPFVEFCSVEQLVAENNSILQRRKAGLATTHPEDPLAGLPDADCPPGDVDVNNAFLIGFTDYCDSAIFVDMRPYDCPRIIYDNLNPTGMTYATAFNSIDEFVKFYLDHYE